ncbi:hypothetical protein I0E98_01415 [Pseudomonas lalucatii]|nr:hypothetical protein [Pseudomonas lalucatii]
MNRLLPAVLALLLVWPLLIHAEAAPPSTRPAFTAEQQQWLEEHRQLRVGLLMQAPRSAS